MLSEQQFQPFLHTGWQHEAAARVKWQHRECVVKPIVRDSGDDFVRSPFESTDQDRIPVVSGVVAPSILSPFAP